MGLKKLGPAVADAGPLIHLAEVGCLSFLTLFEQLYIPDTIWLETVGRKRITAPDILALDNIDRQTIPEEEVSRFVQRNNLEALHAGEHESLYLCYQMGIPLILTDDLAVRDAAKKLKLTSTGSLGVVIRAYKNGLASLEEAKRFILALQDISSLFVTRAIVELAIVELHRRVDNK